MPRRRAGIRRRIRPERGALCATAEDPPGQVKRRSVAPGWRGRTHKPGHSGYIRKKMIPSLVHLDGYVPGDVVDPLRLGNVNQDLIVEILSTIHEPKTLQAAGQVLLDSDLHRGVGQTYLEKAKSLMEAAHVLGLGDQAARGQLGGVHKLQAEELTDSTFASFLLLLTEQCLSGLTDLNLSRSNVTGPRMASLSNAILAGRLAKCQYLQLRHNSINDADMLLLSGAVRKMPELRELWLQANRIGNEGMKALVDAVREGNEPEAAGGVALRSPEEEAVREAALPGLRHLYLAFNYDIGGAGWTALAEALDHGSLPELEVLVVDAKHHVWLKRACTGRSIWLR